MLDAQDMDATYRPGCFPGFAGGWFCADDSVAPSDLNSETAEIVADQPSGNQLGEVQVTVIPRVQLWPLFVLGAAIYLANRRR